MVSGVFVHQNFPRPQTMPQNKTDGRPGVKPTFALSPTTDARPDPSDDGDRIVTNKTLAIPQDNANRIPRERMKPDNRLFRMKRERKSHAHTHRCKNYLLVFIARTAGRRNCPRQTSDP